MTTFDIAKNISDALSTLMYYAKECEAIRKENNFSQEEFDNFLKLEKHGTFMLEKLAENLPSFHTIKEIISHVEFEEEIFGLDREFDGKIIPFPIKRLDTKEN